MLGKGLVECRLQLISRAGYVTEYGPVWDLNMAPLVPLPWRHNTFIFIAGFDWVARGMAVRQGEHYEDAEKGYDANLARNSWGWGQRSPVSKSPPLQLQVGLTMGHLGCRLSCLCRTRG